ncbi:MAG: PhzF family phenazine biosynthesis protein [Bacteroidota bacterium]
MNNEIDVRLYDSFSDIPFGGNIAGIVFERDEFGLDDKSRQLIARELAAPTTGFLKQINNNEFSIQFFSSTSEMDMCGHVTIAAFAAAYDENKIVLDNNNNAEIILSTKAGKIKISISKNSKYKVHIQIKQRPPNFERFDLDEDVFVKNLGIRRSELSENLPIGIVSTGLRHLFVGLINIETLSAIKTNDEALFEFSRINKIDTIGLYAMSKVTGITLRLRDFCHGVGNPEESASGTTNGALACHLTKFGILSPSKKGKVKMVAQQGFEMKRPSIVKTELTVNEKLNITDVYVSGSAYRVMSGKLYY